MLSRRLQIFLIVIFALVLLWLIRQVKKKKLDLRFTLSWLLLAIVLLVLSIFPGILNVISNLLGIYDPVNMIFFCGFAFSLLVIYTLTAAVSKMTNEIKSLAQRIALLEQGKTREKGEETS